MTGSPTKSGSPERLTLRLTRGIMWSVLTGAAVLGILLAAALLTRSGIAEQWNASPAAGLVHAGPPPPGARAHWATAWAEQVPGNLVTHPGRPSPTIVDVVPVSRETVQVSLLDPR